MKTTLIALFVCGILVVPAAAAGQEDEPDGHEDGTVRSIGTRG